jgi:hypothetical protein
MSFNNGNLTKVDLAVPKQPNRDRKRNISFCHHQDVLADEKSQPEQVRLATPICSPYEATG